jgi:ATP adenylyltransferase
MADRLWAPWRMTYIEQPSTGTDDVNIFVDLPAKNSDREHLILYRGKVAFVMLNAFPYTNGHLLIAPYRQTPDLSDLNDEELLEINQLLAKSVRWIRKVYGPDGFNVGVNMGRAAGAGIPVHVHWHIVPRWNGDTNFMTTVGEVRVLPQTLEQSYDRLKEVVDADA